MTEEQKKAICILNRIKEPVIKMGDLIQDAAISEDEYFTLLEFIINGQPQQTTFIPYVPPQTTPWVERPWYMNPVTCSLKDGE